MKKQTIILFILEFYSRSVIQSIQQSIDIFIQPKDICIQNLPLYESDSLPAEVRDFPLRI